MNILSLFDGMSCGQLALQKAGIKVNKYYASEIDKYAIAVTQHNFPDTIQLGDVTQIQASDLDQIDLLIGGSPCQGFSFAGKQLNFDDPRSKLFFEYVRLLKECKPKYFLLENVKMKKEYQDIISGYLGIEPIEINSSLVSAQNRRRLYWTNIPNVGQPEDKGILLKDILEEGYVTKEMTTKGKSFCLTARYSGAVAWNSIEKKQRTMIAERPCELKEYNKNSVYHHIANAVDIKGNESIKRVYHPEGKSLTLTTMGGGHREPKVLIVPEATKKGYTEVKNGDCFDYALPNSKTRRGRNMKDKSNCLQTSHNFMRCEHPIYRKLTPLECERLQTVPSNYTLVPFGKRMMSNTQRYKMLGNGWTVDVIAHIFNNIKQCKNLK